MTQNISRHPGRVSTLAATLALAVGGGLVQAEEPSPNKTPDEVCDGVEASPLVERCQLKSLSPEKQIPVFHISLDQDEVFRLAEERSRSPLAAHLIARLMTSSWNLIVPGKAIKTSSQSPTVGRQIGELALDVLKQTREHRIRSTGVVVDDVTQPGTCNGIRQRDFNTCADKGQAGDFESALACTTPRPVRCPGQTDLIASGPQ